MLGSYVVHVSLHLTPIKGLVSLFFYVTTCTIKVLRPASAVSQEDICRTEANLLFIFCYRIHEGSFSHDRTHVCFSFVSLVCLLRPYSSFKAT